MPGVEIPQISEEPTEQPEPTEDQRWEPDKATDLAHLLKEESPLDYNVQNRDTTLEHAKDDARFPETKEIEREEAARAELKRRYEGHQPGSDEDNWLQQQLAEADARIDELRQSREKRRAKAVDISTESVHEQADRFLLGHKELREHEQADSLMKGPEDIYDTNPNLFANMPTGEFMKIVHEAETMSYEVADCATMLKDVQDYQATLESYDQQQKPVDRDFVLRYGKKFLSADEQMAAKLDIAAFTSSYDRSPREIAADIKVVFADVTKAYEAALTAAKAKLDEFMSQYAPAQTPEAAPES